MISGYDYDYDYIYRYIYIPRLLVFGVRREGVFW